MKRPTLRGCAGALVAVAVMAVAIGIPGTMADVPLAPRVETFISAACGGSSPCPTPERLRWLGELEGVLSERMPALPEPERSRLAGAIYDEARAASLDPLFVLAVIAVESGFDHVAESDRGARGLMQLRPSTLRREAARSKLAGEDPDDPTLNVRAGVRYFVRLLRAFGSIDVALMAYNAGPNRILRFIEDEGGIPDRFLEYPERIHREHVRLKRRHVRVSKYASRVRLGTSVAAASEPAPLSGSGAEAPAAPALATSSFTSPATASGAARADAPASATSAPTAAPPGAR